MDIDQMGGSTLQAMADAVEGADVFLMCMSNKYKHSPACRAGKLSYYYILHYSFCKHYFNPFFLNFIHNSGIT